MRRLVLLLFLLACPARLLAEPPEKPVLTFALDEGPHSEMLKKELVRNWLKPNTALKLTEQQLQDTCRLGLRLNYVHDNLYARVCIRFTGRESVPVGHRGDYPMVRLGRGLWESMDKQAFAREGLPLSTASWYAFKQTALQEGRNGVVERTWMSRNFAIVNGGDWGYAGGKMLDIAPPWEISQDWFPSYVYPKDAILPVAKNAPKPYEDEDEPQDSGD